MWISREMKIAFWESHTRENLNGNVLGTKNVRNGVSLNIITVLVFGVAHL